MSHAARKGDGLRAVPAGTARRIGLDALTVSAVVCGGLPELVWSDPPEGLGPELEELQFALGDGPTSQVARQGRPLTEPDLAAAEFARWPGFLSAVAHTPARAVIAVPLQLGAATVGVLAGYRTSPGAPTAALRRDFHRLGRLLLTLLMNSVNTAPAGENGTEADLVLYRAETHQAVGFLSSALGIPLDEALLRLRARAAADDRPLTDLALALLERRLSAETFDV
ncbi:GAF domain-containing protein [Streptomyces poonensis]|uniref:GAF domain-containing protein n=1 Tax=Streptomyces poonensis TaxID=68255 RepID=UPI0022F309C9|nr:GAF domain-containing protein [Streptomyces poonensis]